jgi:hypothetical protein
MKIAGFATSLLAALLLGGCDSGSDFRDDATAANAINPYPPGIASPFFFRSAADWLPYANQQSARVHQTD